LQQGNTGGEPITEAVEEAEAVLHPPVSTATTNRTNKGDADSVAFAGVSSGVSGRSCWQFCAADFAKEEARTTTQLLFLPQPISIAITIAITIAIAIAIAAGEGPFALPVGG
jgi:hypothetical protein